MLTLGSPMGLMLADTGRAALGLSFLSGPLDPRITFSRASTATDLLYTAISGAYTSYSTNVARLLSDGFLIDTKQRKQLLGVSDTPATQTTGSLAIGSYCLWVIGSGSAAVTAGTATITGAGSATQGTFLAFNVTVAGTVTVTVTGSLSRFQLEDGAFPTSYIPNAGAAGTSVTRAQDIVSIATSTFAYQASSGTFYLKFIPRSSVSSTNVLAMVGAGRFIGTTDDSSTATHLHSYDGTTDTETPNTVPLNAVAKVVSAWQVGQKWAMCANGGAIGSGASNVSLTNLAASTIGLGMQNNGANGPGILSLQELRYYPTRLSDAAIRALTA